MAEADSETETGTVGEPPEAATPTGDAETKLSTVPAEPGDKRAGRRRFKRTAGAADEAHTPTAPDTPAALPAEQVARAYFAAIDDHDLDAAVALWAPGGREHVRGQIDGVAPDDVREFIGALLRA